MQLTIEQLETEQPPRFKVGDRVFIRDEDDRVLGKYPYTVGRRYRYGGDVIWTWSYDLHGITGERVTTVFEDQVVAR